MKRHSADYIDRTIATIRQHNRDGGMSAWPSWSNILADEIEDLRLALEAKDEALRAAEHPELWSSAAEGIGREGIVTVWDDKGRYLGCMGSSQWADALAASRTEGQA